MTTTYSNIFKMRSASRPVPELVRLAMQREFEAHLESELAAWELGFRPDPQGQRRRVVDCALLDVQGAGVRALSALGALTEGR